jgi:hypothetical protein
MSINQLAQLSEIIKIVQAAALREEERMGGHGEKAGRRVVLPGELKRKSLLDKAAALRKVSDIVRSMGASGAADQDEARSLSGQPNQPASRSETKKGREQVPPCADGDKPDGLAGLLSVLERAGSFDAESGLFPTPLASALELSDTVSSCTSLNISLNIDGSKCFRPGSHVLYFFFNTKL